MLLATIKPRLQLSSLELRTRERALVPSGGKLQVLTAARKGEPQPDGGFQTQK